MSLENAMADTLNTAVEVTKLTTKLAETAVKKAWNLAEAATEKKAPGEYLSKQALNAVQGKE